MHGNILIFFLSLSLSLYVFLSFFLSSSRLINIFISFPPHKHSTRLYKVIQARNCLRKLTKSVGFCRLIKWNVVSISKYIYTSEFISIPRPNHFSLNEKVYVKIEYISDPIDRCICLLIRASGAQKSVCHHIQHIACVQIEKNTADCIIEFVPFQCNLLFVVVIFLFISLQLHCLLFSIHLYINSTLYFSFSFQIRPET